VPLSKELKRLAAFIVAVIVIILGLTVNLDTIKDLASGTQIVVASRTRGEAREYLAGEVLRLSLKNVSSSKVFWAFDEGQPVPGSVEAQYAFPFDARVPLGQARDRRVDAFFKRGDSYRTTNTLVRTRNIKYAASVGVNESRIALKAPSAFGTDWSLTGASLALFSGGKFTKQRPLVSQPATTGGEFIASRKDAIEAFGYADEVSLPSALKADERAWTWYNFKNRTTGAVLTIAQPVATSTHGQ